MKKGFKIVIVLMIVMIAVTGCKKANKKEEITDIIFKYAVKGEVLEGNSNYGLKTTSLFIKEINGYTSSN